MGYLEGFLESHVIVFFVMAGVMFFSTLFFQDKEKQSKEKSYQKSREEDLEKKLKKEKEKNKDIKKRLKGWDSNVKGYIEVYYIERKLRNFIEKKMKKVYGDKWENKIPKKVKDSCREWRKKVEDSPKTKDSSKSLSLLHYATLRELGDTMKENWKDVFKDHFGKNKSHIITGPIEDLIPLRDKISHNRKINRKELKVLKKNVEAVKEKL